MQGALALFTPMLAIRRTAGDLPSRVADNFYWLGRYLERLEEAARLQRAIITRILRPSPTAREIAEMQILVASLTKIKMMDAEDASRAGRRHAGVGGHAGIPPRRRDAPGPRPCGAAGRATA